MNITLVDDKKTKQIQENLDGAFGKLVAVFKSEENLSKRKPKVKNQEVSNIVDELIKEEVEQIRKDFKDKAKNLIKSKIEFEKFVEDKKAEMQKAINTKAEEFIKASDDLFKMIESIDELKQTYAAALKPTE